jgi:hypothetical protein
MEHQLIACDRHLHRRGGACRERHSLESQEPFPWTGESHDRILTYGTTVCAAYLNLATGETNEINTLEDPEYPHDALVKPALITRGTGSSRTVDLDDLSPRHAPRVDEVNGHGGDDVRVEVVWWRHDHP